MVFGFLRTSSGKSKPASSANGGSGAFLEDLGRDPPAPPAPAGVAADAMLRRVAVRSLGTEGSVIIKRLFCRASRGLRDGSQAPWHCDECALSIQTLPAVAAGLLFAAVPEATRRPSTTVSWSHVRRWRVALGRHSLSGGLSMPATSLLTMRMLQVQAEHTPRGQMHRATLEQLVKELQPRSMRGAVHWTDRQRADSRCCSSWIPLPSTMTRCQQR